MKGIRLTVPEVAPVVGMSVGEMRKRLRQGKLPYGKATLMEDHGNGKKRFRYDIWLPKLLEETGLKEWPPQEGGVS